MVILVRMSIFYIEFDFEFFKRIIWMLWEDKMRIAICDDEKNVREYIKDRINVFDKDIDVVCFENGEDII